MVGTSRVCKVLYFSPVCNCITGLWHSSRSPMDWLQKETWEKENAFLCRFLLLRGFGFAPEFVSIGLLAYVAYCNGMITCNIVCQPAREWETITVAPIQMEMEDKYRSTWNTNTRKCETNTVGPVEMQEMQFRVVWTVAGGASLHLHLWPLHTTPCIIPAYNPP